MDRRVRDAAGGDGLGNLARELWGHPSAAIGKRVRPYAKGAWRDVVGVVSDMRDDGLNKKAPTVAYWPLLMADFFVATPENQKFVQRNLTYVIRSSRTGSNGFVDDLGPRYGRSIPTCRWPASGHCRRSDDASLARTSFTLVMLAIAGGMALLLGVAGIYGVISYSVSQRTREIGIRIALGAQRQAVTRMFVAHGLMLAAAGVAIGLVAAFGAMRVISSLLFEVSPVDPLTYGMVSLTLIAATVLASYVPALRATAVDPIEALRSE